MEFTSQEFNKLLDTAELDGISVNLPGKFTLKGKNRRHQKFRICYDGNKVCKRSRENLTVEFLNEFISRINSIGGDIPDAVEDSRWSDELRWICGPGSSDPESIDDRNVIAQFKTPIDGNEVLVVFETVTNDPQIKVDYPVEKKEQKSNYGSQIQDRVKSVELAMVNAICFITQYRPAEVDRLKRMEEIALEEFQSIKGIGKKKVKTLVNEKHIRTYEELEGRRLRTLSSNYEEEARNHIRKRVDSDSCPSNHSSVRKIDSHIAVEKL